MSIALIVTRGYGNGTLTGSVKDVVLRGYGIGEVSQVSPCPPTTWSDTSANTAIYYHVNPTETTWDSESTFWDLQGNVYETLFDVIDDTWADVSANSATWRHAEDCLMWDGGELQWDLINNVHMARWY